MKAASIKDLATLVALDQNIFFDHWSESQWKTYLTKEERYPAYFLLDSASGEVQGFALFNCILDEVELLKIGLLPNFRGHGIAGRALEYLLVRLAASGKMRVMLEVRKSNSPAIELYRKLGFENDGMRKDYYPSLTGSGHEDALLMSKKLSVLKG